MKILLTTLEGNIYPVEVSEDLELVNLKALCEQEVNIPSSEVSLSHNGRPLTDDYKSLSSYSIKENDILVVQKIISMYFRIFEEISYMQFFKSMMF